MKSTFNMKNQRNWIKQVLMLSFLIGIICILLYWWKKLTLSRLFSIGISYVFFQVAAALQAQQQLQNNSSSNSTSINSTSNSGSQPPMSNSMMKSPTNNNLISTTSTTSANTHSSSQSLVSSLHSHFGGSSQLSSNEASAVSQIWKNKK